VFRYFDAVAEHIHDEGRSTDGGVVAASDGSRNGAAITILGFFTPAVLRFSVTDSPST